MKNSYKLIVSGTFFLVLMLLQPQLTLAHSPKYVSDLDVLGQCFGAPGTPINDPVCTRLDFNNDGSVNFADIAPLQQLFVTSFNNFDLNQDLLIDPAAGNLDLLVFLECLGSTSDLCASSDFNGDGVVDTNDQLIFEDGLQEALVLFDFNEDGIVYLGRFFNHNPVIVGGNGSNGSTFTKTFQNDETVGMYFYATDSDFDDISFRNNDSILNVKLFHPPAPLPDGTLLPLSQNIIMGDIDKNGVVDQTDIDEITIMANEDYEIALDLNNDGLVNIDDIDLVNSFVGKNVPGVFMSLPKDYALGAYQWQINAIDEHSGTDFLRVVVFITDSSQAVGDYNSYDDVVVIINDNSAASVQIGAYFASKRNIPEQNIIHIAAREVETIGLKEYWDTIKTPVQNYLTRLDTSNEINYIVTTKGLPLRVWEPASPLPPVNSNFPNKPTRFSVDSALTKVDDLNPLVTQHAGADDRNGTHFSYSGTNPYTGREIPFLRKTFGHHLVSRLTGYTVFDAMRLVDKADHALDSVGTFVFDVDPNRDNSSFKLGNDWIRNAADSTQAAGYPTLLDETTTFVTDQANVLGYSSWGSNDSHDHLTSVNAIPRFDWAPGSIADTIVSTSGRTFTAPATYGQSLIADLIEEGVSAAAGHVFEPFLTGVANQGVLFDHYARGFNLADAYWSAVRSSYWQDVLVGDPKMRINNTLIRTYER